MARGCESGIGSVLFSLQEEHGQYEDITEECFEQCLFVLHCCQPDSSAGANAPVLSKPEDTFKANLRDSLFFLSKDLLFSKSNEIIEIRLLFLSPVPPFLFYKSHYKGVKY